MTIGPGQYRNAVASGPRLTRLIRMHALTRRYRVTVLTSSKSETEFVEAKLK